MSSGSMWAPANVSQTVASPPPRTPRRNGTPNHKEAHDAPASNSTPPARHGPRTGVQETRWKRPKELLGEPDGGAASLLSRIDFGGSPPPMSPSPAKKGSARVDREAPPHTTIDVTKAKNHNVTSRLDKSPAFSKKSSSLDAHTRTSKWSGIGVAGSSASKWAVSHVQGSGQEGGQSEEEKRGDHDDVDLEHYINKLDIDEPQDVVLSHKEESVDDVPHSAQTSNFDASTMGASEPSVAGPSTPPSRQSELSNSGVTPTTIPSTPIKYDWADEDDDDLDVDNLAAEWGLSVPGQSKGNWKAEEGIPASVKQTSPEITRGIANKAAPVSNSLSLPKADIVATKSLASDKTLRQPLNNPPPIELLPASPSPPLSSSVPLQGHTLAPPSATPAPTIRSPRKDRPKPEIRNDAFARLSKGLYKNQGRD